ncbi:MATE family efflux transporter [Oceanirhabdus sp. W0125-5]|uniref:MATE family efflux transporter n=1 Tax=Oceanirhabdus sp. W0125-5 TaxID=2999116 RepID=UPI0022F31AA5|nr:MATE family efflux transporter [Oceanirhabdus sp. W0125-5]WBW99072.1 MATE family efflux transporter [Oceanirhabdus sp. W0125-5]
MKSKKILILSIITMSMPAILEMALNTMLGVADTIMISKFIGKEALSAVGFANQIVFALIFIFSSFNTGAVAMISRAFGEKNFDKLKQVAEQNVVLNLIIGITISIAVYIFRNSIFGIYSISEEVFRNTITYFNIIIIGMVPMFLSFSYAAILRGSGDTKTPMKITAIANGVNIIGNYLLIKGIGPLPEMGIAGAALSTSISRIIAVLLYIYILYIKDSSIKLKFELFINKKIVKPLWRISMPGAFEQALMQGSFVVLGVIISQLDTSSEAAFRILIQVESLSFMPAVGISIATATLVGKALGEKDVHKASETGYISSALGVIWGILMAIVFIAIPGGILKAFSSDTSVLAIGATAMLFLALNQPGLNFMIVMSGALRGAGDTTAVMLYTSLRLWVIFVPISSLLILVLNMGIAAVWYAEILSFVIFSVVIFLRFRSKKWADVKV